MTDTDRHRLILDNLPIAERMASRAHALHRGIAAADAKRFVRAAEALAIREKMQQRIGEMEAAMPPAPEEE